MNRTLMLRIGMTASASVAVHLAVFAAVAPGDGPAQAAGGGAEIHIGSPPDHHGASKAGKLQPEPASASMRPPEPKAPEPAPAPKLEPRPKPAKQAPSPIADAELEPVPIDTPETPPAAPPEMPAPARPAGPANAGTGAENDTGDQAERDASDGPDGKSTGDAGDAQGTEDGASGTAGLAATADTDASGPGNAASTNYAGLVMQHLSKVRRPRASSPGSAFVAFTVGLHGELEDLRIAKSSRSARFDRDALKVVRRAAPFPVPPPGVNRSFSVEIEGA